MKKFILPIILLLTAVFFLPPKADAQTRQECEKTRARASYNCLTGRTKCYYQCVDKTKDVKACSNTCGQSEDACEKQVEGDYQACLGTIKKDSENPIETKASLEVKTNTDCHEAFNNESNSCLKEDSKCINSCVDKANEAMSLTVDGGKVNLECQRNICDPASETCNNKAKANFKTCLDARKAKKESVPEIKKETPKQTPPVFIGEWFSKFSQAIDGLIALPGAFADVVYEDKFYLAGDFPKLSEISLEDFYQGNWYPNDDTPDRLPNITAEDEQKAWDFGRLDTPLTEKVSVVVLQGEAQLKSPTSHQFIPIGSKGGDTVQVSYLDSTMRTTSDAVQLRYAWSADAGTVINVPKWSEIKFREPVEVEGFTSHTVELEQGEIEVKVKNNKPAENQFGIDAGWLGVTASRTHFWVSQSQDKKLAVIGVYEGEVEVKTKSGKTIKVKPDGGKPGVAVVSQKLSVVKLTVAVLVLAVIIGGVVLILKKFAVSAINKKKK